MRKDEELAVRLYAHCNKDASDRITDEAAVAIENLLIENRALRQINEKQTALSRQMFDEMESLRKQLHETKSELESFIGKHDALKRELERANEKCKALKNELCYKCGNYEQAHNGWCDHCRWKNGV